MCKQTILHDVHFLLKGENELEYMPFLKLLRLFQPIVVKFLNDLSKSLRNNDEAAKFADIATFAFFCRKANLIKLEKPYRELKKNNLGRGVSFHIAPSNVPINFAYSLVVGLLSGNACIVRVSQKDFLQVDIVCAAMQTILEREEYKELKKYIVIVRYGHDININSYFSSLCDIRVIWGGDKSISEIRKAPLPPHSFDITFSDRYSICLINAENYILINDKDKIANDFYNDTYLFDQNACSSPRLIVWIGNDKVVEQAKNIFWEKTYQILEKKKYKNEAITVVDKYSTVCRAAIALNNAKLKSHKNNLVMRVEVDTLKLDLLNYFCSGGVFYEYVDTTIAALINILVKKYQTLTYIGFEPNELRQAIIENGTHGVDRVVPVGEATSFSLVWDGYDLISQMSRAIEIS